MDPWGFEDQPVETWAEILRPQALDLVLLTLFLTFALVSFFRKSERLKYAALVAAVVYIGFGKSFLISIVNVFGVMALTRAVLPARRSPPRGRRDRVPPGR